MPVVSGSDRDRGFHQQGGPKELLERHQLRELMRMVVETRDWNTKGDGIYGASMIDNMHTTLIILQLHMPIVQKSKDLRGYPKTWCRTPYPQCPTP